MYKICFIIIRHILIKFRATKKVQLVVGILIQPKNMLTTCLIKKPCQRLPFNTESRWMKVEKQGERSEQEMTKLSWTRNGIRYRQFLTNVNHLDKGEVLCLKCPSFIKKCNKILNIIQELWHKNVLLIKKKQFLPIITKFAQNNLLLPAWKFPCLGQNYGFFINSIFRCQSFLFAL